MVLTETVLLHISTIALFSFIALILALISYPYFIKFLIHLKAWKKIRDEASTWWIAEIFKQLHEYKAWTPTMWWWLFLGITWIMIIISLILQDMWYINNSLLSSEETFVPLVSFYWMGVLWLIDDVFNIMGKRSIKWLTAKVKLFWMFAFSAFISYWFFFKLGVSHINMRPLGWERDIGIFMLPLTFIATVAIVNAVNIADGLDGLAWWLLLFIFLSMAVICFSSGQFLATTLISVICAVLIAFLWFNIKPAKIFMGDSWSLALWWLLATLVYLINMRSWILIPFLVLFFIFEVELLSSALQMFSKKFFKRKIIPIAPFHHTLEYRWMKEYSIVMKFWIIQILLILIALLIFFFQFT